MIIKVVFQNGKHLAGTPENIVKQMAARDHHTSIPDEYMTKVQQRVKEQYNVDIHFFNATEFLDALANVNLVHVILNPKKEGK
jgi:hypothetical protein